MGTNRSHPQCGIPPAHRGEVSPPPPVPPSGLGEPRDVSLALWIWALPFPLVWSWLSSPTPALPSGLLSAAGRGPCLLPAPTSPRYPPKYTSFSRQDVGWAGLVLWPPCPLRAQMVSTTATAERSPLATRMPPVLSHSGSYRNCSGRFPSNTGLSFSYSLRDGRWPSTEREKEKRNLSLYKMNIPKGAERG